jgi:hypothetical protein
MVDPDAARRLAQIRACVGDRTTLQDDIVFLLAVLARAEQTIRDQHDNHEAIAERIQQAGENRANCGGSVNPLGAYWEGYAAGLKFAETIYESSGAVSPGSRPATGSPHAVGWSDKREKSE